MVQRTSRIESETGMGIIKEKLSDDSFVYGVRYKIECNDFTIQFDTRTEEDAFKLEQAIRTLTICSSVEGE